MTARLILVLLAGGATAAAGETIDRVVVVVGRQVITDSEIRLQSRITAFLNGETPDVSGPARRKTAERLIEQALLGREIELARFPWAEPLEAEKMFREIGAARFKSEEQFRAALADCRIEDEQLKQALVWQLTVLRFVDFRFRAAIHIPEANIQARYGKLYPDGKGPKLEEIRTKLEKMLTDERVDQALDGWLRDARAQARIEIRGESFQ